MVRTIWLAATCLAVLGAVAVGKALNTPATQTILETTANGATIDASLTQEPLAKADRLQITNVHQEASTEAASQPIEPVPSDVPNSISPEEPIIVNRHWHDPNDTSIAKSKQLRGIAATRKDKSAAGPKGSQATDRAKPGAQTRPCNRTGIGDFLRSLNLSPACDS
ncbi:MAG: hypothetical protein P4M05_16610 [Bradyrhizobium sp.]|nr:hypothetical protein [Bradyrhizobium sp.]